MYVTPADTYFNDVADFLGLTAAELRARDRRHPLAVSRWLAATDERIVGVATAATRPDARTFLRIQTTDVAAYGPLANAASQGGARRLYTTVEEADAAAMAALVSAGFNTEIVVERFCVPFNPALAAVHRAWTPSGFTLEPADQVDHDRLFALDTAIRCLVPGTEGWRGDRAMFDEEIAAAAFEPSAYLVAVHRSGDHAGLVRIWRNSDGPRLGLLGVLPEYRSPAVAAALLKASLRAAASWGFDAFTTETSLTNRALHARLVRLGAERLGRFRQLVRVGSG